MAKYTVTQLAETLAAQEKLVMGLMARLDTAATFCKVQAERIAKLEERDTKTRKQLWYLQRVAKGEFTPKQAA